MEIREFHWLMNIVQNLDVGLVVLDKGYRVQVWNGFMESHSGRLAGEVRDQVLFDLFPDVDRAWLERKANMVFKLNNRAFSTWEQRPYLLRFSNYRPITGSAPYMYQNLTLVPPGRLHRRGHSPRHHDLRRHRRGHADQGPAPGISPRHRDTRRAPSGALLSILADHLQPFRNSVKASITSSMSSSVICRWVTSLSSP